jgi:succinate dehydrogenase/fumarate reductase flavoprotein subunit
MRMASSLSKRKVDVVIVGAGGSGMRASLQSAESTQRLSARPGAELRKSG